MISDLNQRKQALNPRDSFIIQAPAGSGKTELLVQRYLKLLAVVDYPEEILAITFTRKAVGEMRERILSAINFKKTDTPLESHEKITRELALKVIEKDHQKKWNIIEHPNRLRIQTFDSLNAELIRQMPLLAETGSSLEIHEYPEQLYQKAANNTLRSLEEVEIGKHLAVLLKHLNNNLNQLEALLIDMLGQRNQWLPHLFERPKISTLKLTLEKEIERRLKKIDSLFSEKTKNKLLILAKYAAKNLKKEPNNKTLIPLWHDLLVFPSAEYQNLSLWHGLSELLLTKKDIRKLITKAQGFPAPGEKGIDESEKIKREVAKNDMAKVLTNLGDNKELILGIQEIKLLPLQNFDLNHEKLLNSLSEVLLYAASELFLAFSESKKVDFIELGQRALQSLGKEDNPTNLALSLDYRIKHILVDEFQDTSISQIQLLRILIAGWQVNDGRSLFLVGDPMQSIYGFREADVGLFIQIWESGIGDLKLTPLQLIMNFRSDPTLVNWFNKTFEKIFPNYSDVTTGAVPFTESRSSLSKNVSSKINILTQVGRDDIDEAKKIELIIKNIKNENPNKSIGILARSRSHLKYLAEHLKSSGISFLANDIDLLHDRQIIQDLRTLTRALFHPADRLSWLSLLRSPWIGLTLSDLLKIAENNNEIIYSHLREKTTLSKLSDDGKIRVKRLLEILENQIPMKANINFRSWVEGIWLSLGGYAIAGEENRSDANAFFKLLERVEYLGGHIDLNELDLQINRLYASPDFKADEKVQIMTMHAAKGLEFDAVIIPGLGKHRRRKDSKLMNWIELPQSSGNVELLLAPIRSSSDKSEPISEFLKNIDKQKITFEEIRLLYVAVTRAKQQLFLLGHIIYDKDNNVRTNFNSFLNTLWPAIKKTLEIPEYSSDKKDENKKIFKPEMRLSSNWKLQLNDKSDHIDEILHIDNIEFEWAGDAARHVGTLVHRYLEKISNQGLAKWPLKKIDTIDNQLKVALLNLGVHEKELKNSLIKTKKALKNTLSHDVGKWILSDHPNSENELALTIDDDKYTNIIIDRTFVDDEKRWIIDYKTGDHLGKNIEKFLEDEKSRYFHQLNKYGSVMSIHENRLIMLGLYFPLLKKWKYWQYEPEHK